MARGEASAEDMGMTETTEKGFWYAYALVAIIVCSIIVGGGVARSAESSPEAEELRKLAEQMKQVEGKLREDRHDRIVQEEGEAIEKQMDQMIERIEKQEKQQQAQNKQQQKDKQKQKQQQAQKSEGQKGMQNSEPKPPVAGGPTVPAGVVGNQDKWSKLPPAQRDELLQSYKEEVPEKWRKRLEAYFISISASETDQK